MAPVLSKHTASEDFITPNTLHHVPGKRLDKRLILINNRNYVIDKNRGPVLYLRCRNFRRNNGNCPARGKLVGNNYSQTSKEGHTCSDTDDTWKILTIKERLKTVAVDYSKPLKKHFEAVLGEEPKFLGDEIVYKHILPAMAYQRRRKWPRAIKTVPDMVEYYELGGSDADEIAKACYLGHIQVDDDDGGTLLFFITNTLYHSTTILQIPLNGVDASNCTLALLTVNINKRHNF